MAALPTALLSRPRPLRPEQQCPWAPMSSYYLCPDEAWAAHSTLPDLTPGLLTTQQSCPSDQGRDRGMRGTPPHFPSAGLAPGMSCQRATHACQPIRPAVPALCGPLVPGQPGPCILCRPKGSWLGPPARCDPTGPTGQNRHLGVSSLPTPHTQPFSSSRSPSFQPSSTFQPHLAHPYPSPMQEAPPHLHPLRHLYSLC